MASRTILDRFCETRALPLITAETVEIATPARWATSLIVAIRQPVLESVPTGDAACRVGPALSAPRPARPSHLAREAHAVGARRIVVARVHADIGIAAVADDLVADIVGEALDRPMLARRDIGEAEVCAAIGV